MEFPGCLGGFVGLDVCCEVRAGGVPWRSWYMRAKGYWFHNWVVSGVSDEGLGEVVHDGVSCGEEYVGSVGVHGDAGELASAFFCVFL